MLWFSVGINVIFLVVCSCFIRSKGGITYIVNKFHAAFRSAPTEKNVNTRADLFKTYKRQENGIMFLGDSLTQGIEWSELFPNHHIYNRGIGGETTDAIIARLDEVIQKNPSKLFIMMGTNDIGRGSSSVDVMSNYKKLVSRIKSELTQTEIYIQSVLPSNNQMKNGVSTSNEEVVSLNKRLEEYASVEGITYIDIHPKLVDENKQLAEKYTVDGLHLTPEGYSVWIDTINDYV